MHQSEVPRSAVNQYVVQGLISELSPLRYTPAGVPVLEFLLMHESEVTEASQTRRLSFSIGSGDDGRFSSNGWHDGSRLQGPASGFSGSGTKRFSKI